MTTRLKILSFGLIVSLIVAVTDYVNRNNERPKPSVRNKKSSVSPKRQSYKSKITRQKKIIEDGTDMIALIHILFFALLISDVTKYL